MGCNRGLSGVAALIILVAVILVSSIAAVVIIYSTGGLQTTAVRSSFEAEESVTSGMEVMYVMGTDGSAGRDIEHFEVLARLLPGSSFMNLTNMVVVVTTKQYTQNIYYNQSAGDTTSNAATTSDFTVEYVKASGDHRVGYLTRGDVIRMRFNYYSSGPADTTGGIGEDEDVRIVFVPHHGNPTPLQFRTPTPINEKREPLWPSEQLL